jgi:RNA polymerase-binding transcription factor DksA
VGPGVGSPPGGGGGGSVRSVEEPAAEPAALDLEELVRAEAELADVEHALGRLDAGTYGTCEVCAGPADEDRLAAAPATRTCATHG